MSFSMMQLILPVKEQAVSGNIRFWKSDLNKNIYDTYGNSKGWPLVLLTMYISKTLAM